jgi:hypothetical protein
MPNHLSRRINLASADFGNATFLIVAAVRLNASGGELD